MAQLQDWFDDYFYYPHSALGYLLPQLFELPGAVSRMLGGWCGRGNRTDCLLCR